MARLLSLLFVVLILANLLFSTSFYWKSKLSCFCKVARMSKAVEPRCYK